MRSDYAVITARSPRTVVLLPDLAGPDGARADSDLDRVLEWFGRVWGGAHMLCIPARDGAVSPVFRRIAAAYDPDVVLPWQPTLGSLWQADSDAARALVARAAQRGAVPAVDDDDAMAKSTLGVGGRADPELLGAELPTFVRQPASHPPLAAHHLQQDLPAPLTALSRLAQHPRIDGTGRPLAPATAADAAREAVGRPSIDLDLQGLDAWRRRLLKARLGVVGASGAAEPAGLRLPGEVVVRYSVNPAADTGACASVGLTGAFAGHEAPAWATPGSLAETPVERSRTGLQTWSYFSALPRRFLLVAGDTVEDFCLYLCWHRTYGEGSAAWLPAAAVDEARRGGDVGAEAELVRDMLLDLPGRTYEGGWISSFSLRAEELEPLRSALTTHHWHPDIAPRFADMPIVAADDLPVAPAPASFVATGDVFDRPTPLVIDDDDGTAWPVVRSPVPALLAAPGTAGSGAVLGNWVADVTVAGCRLPARREAARAAELDDSLIDTGLVRVGRTGTAFVAVARDDLPSGLLVDHGLTGLSLRDPDLGRLLTGLLPDGTRWELSDAGRFYQGLADMAGGLAALVAMLRDPATYSVLSGFLDTAKAPGRAVLTDGRRYLRSFECREEIRRTDAGASTPAGTREVLDGLLAAKIISRGLVLKCSRCRHTAFQPLPGIGDGFQCPRCTFEQPLISAAWCGIPSHEPAWFYRLDELAYQALDKHVRVPALALDRLGACSPQARHLWSIELWREGRRWLELDFVCLADGRLSTGEAKSNGVLKGKQALAEVRKTVDGARALQADQVVFATTDKEWSEALQNAAKKHTDVRAAPSLILLSGLR